MSKSLKELDTRDYVHIDDGMPTEDATYDVIYHCGSMSVSYKKMESRFRNNQFSRWDWDYVIMWKPFPLMDLSIGEWITNGKETWQWVGTQMGTRGCWRANENI